jgi:hypothetical protein
VQANDVTNPSQAIAQLKAASAKYLPVLEGLVMKAIVQPMAKGGPGGAAGPGLGLGLA